MPPRLTVGVVRRVAAVLEHEDGLRFTEAEVQRNRARRMAARRSQMERKADTRHKIQLGGLVVKAGLGQESSNVLLGLLLEAARALRGPKGTSLRGRFETAGKEAFEREQHTDTGVA